MNPCDTPCPKCGSADIYRRFFDTHEVISDRSEKNLYPRNSYACDSWNWRASRAFIGNKCRTCEHVFPLKPLPRKAKLPANTGEKP